MSHTISIRLSEDANQRLEALARQTGRTRSAIVKEALDRSLDPEPKAFMALAGSIKGAPTLSQRKGFAKK